MLRSAGCTRNTRFKPPTHAHLQACAWKYAESRHWMLLNCAQPHPVTSMPTHGQQASADLHSEKFRPIQKRFPYCLYGVKHCCWCGDCHECAIGWLQQTGRLVKVDIDGRLGSTYGQHGRYRRSVRLHGRTWISALSQELGACCRPTETGAGPSDARVAAAASHFTGVFLACA